MPDIQSNGRTIHFQTTGNATNSPILFIHGWLTNHHLWETTIEALQKNFYCIAPDLLGHGQSDVSAAADFSIQAQAHHMLDVIDYLGIDRFSLVGFSMGGQVSGYIAAELAPERVIKWVHVDGTVTGEFTWPLAIRKPMFWVGQYLPFSFNLAHRLMKSKTVSRLLYADILYHHFNRVDFNYWSELHRSGDQAQYARPYTRVQTAIQQFNLLDVAANVKADTLIMGGVHDRVVPTEEMRQLARTVPTAKMLEFEDCGHEIIAEGFSEYIRELKSFLQA